MSGDLKDSYQTLVLNAKDYDMEAVTNILCGNINMDCSYALIGMVDKITGKGK